MSRLSDLLVNFGISEAQLSSLATKIRECPFAICSALQELPLQQEHIDYISHLVMMDPSQIEETAMEYGLSTQEVDEAKMNLYPLVCE